jgi:hypothetical protein
MERDLDEWNERIGHFVFQIPNLPPEEYERLAVPFGQYAHALSRGGLVKRVILQIAKATREAPLHWSFQRYCYSLRGSAALWLNEPGNLPAGFTATPANVDVGEGPCRSRPDWPGEKSPFSVN